MLTDEKISEEMITESICRFLDTQKGFVTRIAPSGFLKDGRMRKHKSRFIRKGIPDILFWKDGQAYAFEVKTPTAHKYILKHIERIRPMPFGKLNKGQMHIREQDYILTQLAKQGVHAGFVSSIEHVKAMVQPLPSQLTPTRASGLVQSK